MQIEQGQFIQYLTIKKKLAPKTVETYVIRLSVIQRWLHEKETELDKYSVETFLFEQREKKLGNAALNTYIQTLNHIMGFYKDRGVAIIDFMDGIESLPKVHPEIIILSVDETERLLSTHLEYKNRNGVLCEDLDLKYLALTRFISITGCRFEEAASLKIKRLDIANGKATLVNTKNKKNRYIFFEGPVKDDLKYLVKGRNLEDLVFTNSKGQHINPGDYNIDLRLRAKAAGISKHVHAHLLRHGYGTELVKAGVDISMVASLMGHSDIQTTYETYIHLADETLQKASFRNPLVRRYVNPTEILKMVRESLNKFHLENDERFNMSIKEEKGKLSFELTMA